MVVAPSLGNVQHYGEPHGEFGRDAETFPLEFDYNAIYFDEKESAGLKT